MIEKSKMGDEDLTGAMIFSVMYWIYMLRCAHGREAHVFIKSIKKKDLSLKRVAVPIIFALDESRRFAQFR